MIRKPFLNGNMHISIINNNLPDEWIDVSHSIGIPLGGLGTGYGVFGKYGFVKINFKGRPDAHSYDFDTPEKFWSYTNPPDAAFLSTFGFFLDLNGKRIALQETLPSWSHDSQTCDRVLSFAYLPRALFQFHSKDLPLKTQMSAFSPLVPHNLDTASTPVQIYEFTIENISENTQTLTLHLLNKDPGVINGHLWISNDNDGQIAWHAESGYAEVNGVAKKLTIASHCKATARFFISWYYPEINHVCDSKRYYTRNYSNASDVINKSILSVNLWQTKIDDWHNSIKAPAFLKRLWFSSLSSVITSTLLGYEPSFYEIETPHPFLNTMDVSCYSSWMYLVNWPQLELMDMNQYFTIIPVDGKKAGYVWHSMIKDEADYVEEPCFITRVYRDFLWFNNREWAVNALDFAKRSALRVYQEAGYDFLINSPHGNQSYDLWKMPGISAFVNSSWIFGLHGLAELSKTFGIPFTLDSIPIDEFKDKAVGQFEKLLWNSKAEYWNCFYRTPDARSGSEPESIFTDQLFGKWMLSIDRSADNILSKSKVAGALRKIYEHNLIIDNAKEFKGWVNGRLPDKGIDKSGYHSYICWFGAQFDLASLLALSGYESESLDVMRSVEASLQNNHLAAGEWNRAVNEDFSVERLKLEPGKDTPRFPPYPRYKSCWEYLIRILGLQMDQSYLYLNPFTSIDFSLDKHLLAGVEITVKIEKNWNCALYEGAKVNVPVLIDRTSKAAAITFIKE